MLLYYGVYYVVFKWILKLLFYIIIVDFIICNILKNLANRGFLDIGLVGFFFFGGGVGGVLFWVG